MPNNNNNLPLIQQIDDAKVPSAIIAVLNQIQEQNLQEYRCQELIDALLEKKNIFLAVSQTKFSNDDNDQQQFDEACQEVCGFNLGLETADFLQKWFVKEHETDEEYSNCPGRKILVDSWDKLAFLFLDLTAKTSFVGEKYYFKEILHFMMETVTKYSVTINVFDAFTSYALKQQKENNEDDDRNDFRLASLIMQILVDHSCRPQLRYQLHHHFPLFVSLLPMFRRFWTVPYLSYRNGDRHAVETNLCYSILSIADTTDKKDCNKQGPDACTPLWVDCCHQNGDDSSASHQLVPSNQHPNEFSLTDEDLISLKKHLDRQFEGARDADYTNRKLLINCIESILQKGEKNYRCIFCQRRLQPWSEMCDVCRPIAQEVKDCLASETVQDFLNLMEAVPLDEEIRRPEVVRLLIKKAQNILTELDHLTQFLRLLRNLCCAEIIGAAGEKVFDFVISVILREDFEKCDDSLAHHAAWFLYRFSSPGPDVTSPPASSFAERVPLPDEIAVRVLTLLMRNTDRGLLIRQNDLVYFYFDADDPIPDEGLHLDWVTRHVISHGSDMSLFAGSVDFIEMLCWCAKWDLENVAALWHSLSTKLLESELSANCLINSLWSVINSFLNGEHNDDNRYIQGAMSMLTSWFHRLYPLIREHDELVRLWVFAACRLTHVARFSRANFSEVQTSMKILGIKSNQEFNALHSLSIVQALKEHFLSRDSPLWLQIKFKTPRTIFYNFPGDVTRLALSASNLIECIFESERRKILLLDNHKNDGDDNNNNNDYDCYTIIFSPELTISIFFDLVHILWEYFGEDPTDESYEYAFEEQVAFLMKLVEPFDVPRHVGDDGSISRQFVEYNKQNPGKVSAMRRMSRLLRDVTSFDDWLVLTGQAEKGATRRVRSTTSDDDDDDDDDDE